MIIIEVCFTKGGNIYKYLLINPNNYKIDPQKTLNFVSGVAFNKPIVKKLWAKKVYKKDTLPKIITSQIVLLDKNNNIDIQKLGEVKPIQEKPLLVNKQNNYSGVSTISESQANFIRSINKIFKLRKRVI